MAKRRRPHGSESASESAYSDSGHAGASDASDEPPEKRRSRTTRRKASLHVRTEGKRTKTATKADEGLELDGIRRLHSKSLHVIHSPEPLRASLLKWFATVYDSRGMPWRKPFDPFLSPEDRAQRAYEVWVSEIMLQQTQVATVIPYYNRWMEKFPTLRDLVGTVQYGYGATSNIEEINAVWKGLGYYSRASRLLAGAQKAVREYGGRLPSNAQELEASIPGIGRYSAGAICSIAFGEQAPVLDGNVHRLLSRFLAIHAPPKAKATLDILWSAALAMVKTQGSTADIEDSEASRVESGPQQAYSCHPGDINQALIELGSTICKVRDPKCSSCPLRDWCIAYQTSTSIKHAEEEDVVDMEDVCQLCQPIPDRSVTVYPMRQERKKAREELDRVYVVEWDLCEQSDSDDARRFLLVKRPDIGLLAGLYEFPTETNVGKSEPRAPETLPRQILFSLLGDAVCSCPPKSCNCVSTTSDGCSPTYRTAKVVLVGDVTHIFSHIKKTYRVFHVVLEGGDDPPRLRAKHDGHVSSEKAKGRGDSKKSATAGNTYTDAKWLPLDKVVYANIGTGVLKVWKLLMGEE